MQSLVHIGSLHCFGRFIKVRIRERKPAISGLNFSTVSGAGRKPGR